MAMNGYMADDLDVICEDLFENIEDFFDFSNDDEALEIAGSGVNCANIATVKSADVAAAPPPPPLSSSESSEGCRVTDASDDGQLCDDINIGEDWISKFLGDDANFEIDFPATAAGDVAATPMFINKDDESLFRSFSPVSVLERSNLPNKEGLSLSSSSSPSSSSTNSNTTNEAETVSLVAPVGPTMMLVPARARTKRPRRAAPASTTLPILPPSSDGPPAIPTILPETESFGESYPIPMKKKKKKCCLPTGANINAEETASAARKCMHCGIQKTPQWRAGPMGPKTLCNACGVRYKSGRLFPEYRPAASPTYVPSIHSNSHKKVVEMRNKVTQYKPVNRPACPAAKNCDLLEYIRRKD